MTGANGSNGPRRIDVHTHLIPPRYVELLATVGVTTTAGRDFPRWSPKKHLRMMDHNGIETSILSVSLPGTYFRDDSFSRELTRACNDYCAELVAEHPGRFGAFASLPLPDVEGSLAELERALDTLKLDGVVLMTSAEGVYLGDPRYDELFAELDRRGVVVFVHPSDPADADERYPVLTALLDRPLETIRAVTRLVTTGTLERFPHIRYILAHGGGGVPFLAERIAATSGLATSVDRSATAGPEPSRLELLRGLYYDTAQPGEALFDCLQELAPKEHVLFGTDAGWATPFETKLTVKAIADYDGFDEAEHRSVGRDNALALFPRFRAEEV